MQSPSVRQKSANIKKESAVYSQEIANIKKRAWICRQVYRQVGRQLCRQVYRQHKEKCGKEKYPGKRNALEREIRKEPRGAHVRIPRLEKVMSLAEVNQRYGGE